MVLREATRMVGVVPNAAYRHFADHARRFTEHHCVRAAGPGQFEPCGDQAVTDGSSGPAPPLRLVCLLC